MSVLWIANVHVTDPDRYAEYAKRATGAIVAHGGVFAGSGIDIGTRLLLDHIPSMRAAELAIDLACGSGVVGATPGGVTGAPSIARSRDWSWTTENSPCSVPPLPAAASYFVRSVRVVLTAL